jgi:LETM1 and EF-hand domain-containing protein 1
MILKEGVDSMTVSELQTACQDRGMRAIGITIERLRSQMRQWLNLNIKEKVIIFFIIFVIFNSPMAEVF